MAIQALEKQIAKKPLERREYCGIEIAICPGCDNARMSNQADHCPACGQLIDWSGEE